MKHGVIVLLSLLFLLLLGAAAAVVYSHHQHRQLFGELVQLERERDVLNIQFSKLQLEQATLTETGRTEQLARERLQMHLPETNEIVVVQQ